MGPRHFSPLSRPFYAGGALHGAWTPDMSKGGLFVGTLSGDLTVNNPIHIPAPGAELLFYFGQDATGGHKITWGSQFAVPAGILLPQLNPGAYYAGVFRFRNTSGGTPSWLFQGGDGIQFRETLTLGTNITAVGGGYDTPAAIVERGSRVHLTGVLQANAAIAQWAQIAAIPTIRPHVIRGVDGGDGIKLAVETNGTILVASAAGIASGTQLFLDGKGFLQ